MEFVYATGGREKYFKATNVGDCVTRAIANATGVDYKEIYDALNHIAKTSRKSKRERGTSNSRNGVHTRIAKKYIEGVLGWIWVPCMGIGTGCQVHVDGDELPKEGNYILNLSKHFTCIKDGVLYDTYDCSRDGSRCVYGYWRKPTPREMKERTRAYLLAQQEKNAKIAQKEALVVKVKAIKDAHSKKIKLLEEKIKKYQHELKLETNRMNREIEKAKQSI